jgi:hypothetical protein
MVHRPLSLLGSKASLLESATTNSQNKTLSYAAISHAEMSDKVDVSPRDVTRAGHSVLMFDCFFPTGVPWNFPSSSLPESTRGTGRSVPSWG